MSGRTSGLNRDLNLVRRRWWLFIPFLIFGVVVALAFGSFSSDSNAVASMTLDTIVHDVVEGGDRGLRIFEAQAMTNDDEFKEKVRTAIGDPNFAYSRFSVALSPISVADGVSRGILTVSILDPNKLTAERYRQAFVDVYTAEYTALDGLYRTRFTGRRLEIARRFDAEYQSAYDRLKALAGPAGVNVDRLLLPAAATSPNGFVYAEEAELRADLAEVQGTISSIDGASPAVAGVLASAALGQAVAGAEAQAALAARRSALEASIAALAANVARESDGQLDPALRAALEETRAYRLTREQSYLRYTNAAVAARSAESTISTSYTFSGGLSGSMFGRVAIALAVTVVFGLIAIYTVEWLTQIRANAQD